MGVDLGYESNEIYGVPLQYFCNCPLIVSGASYIFHCRGGGSGRKVEGKFLHAGCVWFGSALLVIN